MATFKSASHPALTIATNQGSFKFAGGQLTVDDERADEVRTFAERFPQYNIEEVGASAAADESTDDGEDSEEGQDSGPTVAQLQEELRARGLPVSGTKDELLARLAESDDDDEDEDEDAGDNA